MPKFEYTNNSTRAAVSFPAHKFPHTSSIYYQCNVRLCINNGGCESTECTNQNSSSLATSNGNNGPPRSKRSTLNTDGNHNHNQVESKKSPSPLARSDPERMSGEIGGMMSFDVYSGLHVSDLDIGGKYH